MDGYRAVDTVLAPMVLVFDIGGIGPLNALHRGVAATGYMGGDVERWAGVIHQANRLAFTHTAPAAPASTPANSSTSRLPPGRGDLKVVRYSPVGLSAGLRVARRGQSGHSR